MLNPKEVERLRTLMRGIEPKGVKLRMAFATDIDSKTTKQRLDEIVSDVAEIVQLMEKLEA